MTKCDLVIATGGQGVVRRSYSSGTPAFGVGAGNATMIWDETAIQDLHHAADNTMRSKTSDFGSGCSADGNVIIHDSIWDEAIKALQEVGGYVMTEEEQDKMRHAMWDEENLYIAATIMDDTPFMYREGFPPDMADSLVIFLGTDASLDPERTEYAAEDFRITMVIDDYYFNTGIDRDMIADDKGFESIGADGDEQVLDGYDCAIEEIDGGYTFEAVIPLSNLSNDEIPVLVPEAGMVLPFEIGMFDLDFPCPGVATARIQWAGRSMDVDTDPSLWGTITFAE